MSAQNTRDRSLGAAAAVGVLVVAHAAAVVSALDAPEKLPVVHDLAGWAASLIGLTGTVAAARAFAPGDYLRRVWTLRAVASGLLVVSTALWSYWLHTHPGVSFQASPLLPVRALVVVAANLVSTCFLILLAQTYRRAGLTPPSSWQINLLWALGGAAALAISLSPLRTAVQQLEQGGSAAFIGLTRVASTLGDMAMIILVVPMLRVAYLLRGGRLARVWWVMAATGGVWLVYDAREWIAGVLPGDAEANLHLVLVLRTLGLSLMGMAGWLQRDVLTPHPQAVAQVAPSVSGAV